MHVEWCQPTCKRQSQWPPATWTTSLTQPTLVGGRQCTAGEPLLQLCCCTTLFYCSVLPFHSACGICSFPKSLATDDCRPLLSSATTSCPIMLTYTHVCLWSVLARSNTGPCVDLWAPGVEIWSACGGTSTCRWGLPCVLLACWLAPNLAVFSGGLDDIRTAPATLHMCCL